MQQIAKKMDLLYNKNVVINILNSEIQSVSKRQSGYYVTVKITWYSSTILNYIKLYYPIFHWWNVGKGAGFAFDVKQKVCAEADQIPAAFQQNKLKHFSTLWDQHFGRACTANILSEKNNCKKSS